MKPLWHKQATLLSGKGVLGGLNAVWRKVQGEMAEGFDEVVDELEFFADLDRPRIIAHDDPPPPQRSRRLFDSEGRVVWKKPRKEPSTVTLDGWR